MSAKISLFCQRMVSGRSGKSELGFTDVFLLRTFESASLGKQKCSQIFLFNIFELTITFTVITKEISWHRQV